MMRAKSEGWDAPFSGKLTAEKAASTAYRRSYVTVWQRSALQRIAVAALHFNARVGNEEYSKKEASRRKLADKQGSDDCNSRSESLRLTLQEQQKKEEEERKRRDQEAAEEAARKEAEERRLAAEAEVEEQRKAAEQKEAEERQRIEEQKTKELAQIQVGAPCCLV